MIGLVLLAACAAAARAAAVDLTGADWTLTSADGTLSLDGVAVPGSAHTALIAAGVLDDPYYRYGELKYEWVANSGWTWGLGVPVPPAPAGGGARLLLQFDCIDTAAQVRVNGAVVGETASQFLQYTFDVTDAAAAAAAAAAGGGQLQIEVEIEPAQSYSRAAASAYPYEVPASAYFHVWGQGAVPATVESDARNFIRKTASDFGWDWGPKFVPAGLQGGARLMWVAEARLEAAVVRQAFNADGTVTLLTTVYLDAPASAGASGRLSVEIDGQSASQAVQLAAGESSVLLGGVTVAEPRLWWPAGMGEQPLYDLTVTFEGARGSQSSLTKRVGLRTVELVTAPVEGQNGTDFYFQVNGVPLFAKGANFIPADALSTRVTDEQLDYLLTSAVQSNMNMVRVWGGGLYQTDSFYDLCDEKGLLVWQEVMFACAMYPRDQSFLGLVAEEVTQQVRRLSSHASIAIWGGNNENESAMDWYPPSEANRDLYLADYVKLYVDTVREALVAADPTAAFVDSSPSNGLVSVDPFVKRWGDTSDVTRGDVHFYDYDSDCQDPNTYPLARFVSEHGRQSMPSFEGYKPVTEPEDWSRSSDLLRFRQRHPEGDEQMHAQIERRYPVPADDGSPEAFAAYLHLTQVQQALCYETAATLWRRNRYEEAHTMGLLYWQLNDVWEGPSWSSIEYNGNWKAVQYAARRFYETLLVSIEPVAAAAKAVVTNDLSEDVVLDVRFELWSWGARAPDSAQSAQLTAPALGNTAMFDAVDVRGLDGLVLARAVTADGSMREATFVPNPLARNSSYVAPAVVVESVAAGRLPGTAVVAVSSETPAVWVTLEAGSTVGFWSDNVFTLLPGELRTVTFTARSGALDLDAFAAELGVRVVPSSSS